MEVKELEKRLNIFMWAMTLIFAFLAAGLLNLQILNGDEYEAMAQGNRMRIVPTTAARGVFKDRYGRDLVNSRPSFTVSFYNANIPEEDRSYAFDELSDILQMPRFSQITGEDHTVGDGGRISAKFGPLAADSVVVTKTNTGEILSPLKIDTASGRIDLDTEKGVQVTLSYGYDTFENRIRSQGYKKFIPVRLKTDVDFKTVSLLEEKRLPGVTIEIEPMRNYLYGDLGSHIFGYVGEVNREELETLKEKGYRPGDLVGKMGLEKVLEGYLKGKDGGKQVVVTATGTPTSVLGEVDPIPGHTVNLTTDAKIQQVAEMSLREQLHKLQNDPYKPYPNAKRGAAVVLKVKTGEVIAMVSVPGFDPNMFARGITQREWNEIVESPLKPMVNQVIAGTNPPGSIFKMVTATAALEEKVTNEYESFFDPGVYWTILPKKDWKPGGHGIVNIVKAIAESCNIYFYEMGRRLGIDNLEKYTKMYGLGQLTGIELPGEKEGSIASKQYKIDHFTRPDDKVWYPAETLDAAIGQGYNSFTPLQVADYVAAVANEGYWMKPHLIKSIVSASGEVVLEKEPELGGEVTASPETFRIIKKGMRGVTSPGGTAYSVFANFPVEVAGKTGTAEWDTKMDSHGWFAAFAPIEDPEIAVVVFIEQAGSGGSTGGPVAKAVFETYFNLTDDKGRLEYMMQP